MVDRLVPRHFPHSSGGWTMEDWGWHRIRHQKGLLENKSRADCNGETRRTLTLYVEFMGLSKRQWQPWCAQSLHQESSDHSLHISSMHVTWCAGHKISIAVIKHLNNQVKSGKGLLWLLFSERLSHGPLNGQYLMEWHVEEEACSYYAGKEKERRWLLISLSSTHYPAPNSDWKSFH